VNRGTTLRKSVLSNGGRLVDLAGQVALAERTEGDEADAQFLEHASVSCSAPATTTNTRSGAPLPLDGVGAANRLHAGFRQAEVLHLAGRNEILHCAGDVLDRDLRIDAVLVEQIDPIRLQSLQRCVGDFPDVRGAAVEPGLLAAFDLEAKLRRNDDAIAKRRERLSDELFIGERDRRLQRCRTASRRGQRRRGSAERPSACRQAGRGRN
jgi:hypothetical protein